MTPRKGGNKFKGSRIETSNNPIRTPNENIILSYSNAIGTGCLQENCLANQLQTEKCALTLNSTHLSKSLLLLNSHSNPDLNCSINKVSSFSGTVKVLPSYSVSTITTLAFATRNITEIVVPLLTQNGGPTHQRNCFFVLK